MSIFRTNHLFNIKTSRTILGDSAALKTYEATSSGYIESWIDRFRPSNGICNDLEAIYEEDKQYFPTLTGN